MPLIKRQNHSINTYKSDKNAEKINVDVAISLYEMCSVGASRLSGNRAPKPKLGNFRAEYAHIVTYFEVLRVSHR